jgi:hypothetical protein
MMSYLLSGTKQWSQPKPWSKINLSSFKLFPSGIWCWSQQQKTNTTYSILSLHNHSVLLSQGQSAGSLR